MLIVCLASVGWRIWKGIRKSKLCESSREWNREVQEHSSSLKLYQAWVPMGTPLLPNYIGPDTLIMSRWKILTLSELLWDIMLYLWIYCPESKSWNMLFSYFSFQCTIQPEPCSVSAALSREQCGTPNMPWRSVGHETGKDAQGIEKSAVICT